MIYVLRIRLRWCIIRSIVKNVRKSSYRLLSTQLRIIITIIFIILFRNALYCYALASGDDACSLLRPGIARVLAGDHVEQVLAVRLSHALHLGRHGRIVATTAALARYEHNVEPVLVFHTRLLQFIMIYFITRNLHNFFV